MSTRRRAAGAGISIGAALGIAPAAEAADFRVTNINDAGDGSLRQAILSANAAPDADRVLIRSNLSGTISLGSEIAITEPVAISGPGADRLAISGNDAVRIFNIETDPGDPVAIAGLTLRDGFFAYDGGAVRSEDAALTVERTEVTSSTGTGGGADGAGLYVVGTGGASSLALRSSTISGNTSNDAGAGVYTYDLGSAVIDNSTITGNAAGSYGGGAYLNADSLTVSNTTIAGNRAASYAGGLRESSSTKTIVNSIFADNSAPVDPDLRAFSVSLSFSLVEAPGATIITGGPNIIGQDPALAPLADNGGPTRTQALQPTSPAIDQGLASGADQRGAPRPFDLGTGAPAGGNQADIGAYERVFCGRVLVNEVGTVGKDKLKGTKRADGILGLGGRDKLKGRGGKDGLCGGPGRDSLRGGSGNDRLLGQAGRDLLIGGKGKDKLKGGKGKDTVRD